MRLIMVFGKILGKMQLTVKLEGGVPGQNGFLQNETQVFVTIDAMKRSVVFV